MLPSSCFISSRAGRTETISSLPAPSNPAIGGAGACGTLLRRGFGACGRRPGSRSTGGSRRTPGHGRTGRTALGGTGRSASCGAGRGAPSLAVGIDAASGGHVGTAAIRRQSVDDEPSDHHARVSRRFRQGAVGQVSGVPSLRTSRSAYRCVPMFSTFHPQPVLSSIGASLES
jgi:hypothetical protein